MNSRHVKALLMAGGLGTRLRPLTERTPKCLVPIAGRPLLDYWIDALEAAGIRRALINTHHLAEQVREHIARVNRGGSVQIEESHEPALLGSAGTLHANRNFVKSGETCLIVYTDNCSTVDLSSMLRFHRSHGDPVTMVLFRAAHPERCGIATLDDSARIVRFEEKPECPDSNLANGGVYAVDAEAYHQMADMNCFDLANEVLPQFVGQMRGWLWEGYHRDIGTLDALEQANSDAESVFGARLGVTV